MNAKALEYLEAFEPRKALPLLQRQARSHPTYDALVNYAVALRGCGDIERAQTILERAMKIDQTRPQAWCNLAQCCEDLGQFEDCTRLFQRCLELIEKSGTPPTQAGEPLLGFAHSMMRLGQFKYAWPIWEAARYGKSWHPFPGLNPWRGEQDARLLVVPEGGFGDGFNFLRWMFYVGARQATVIVWDQLFEYAKHNLSPYPSVTVLPLSHQFQYDELSRFTHCTPYLSLMAYSMEKWADIPDPLFWAPRGRIIAESNDWIGFCHRAEENGVMRRTRSLDDHAADRLGQYLAKRCERVVGLVPTGKHLYRKTEEKQVKGVTQDEALLTGWEQTALTLLKCKLIVTVDTAIAHLAGSLGVPTLILLPMRSDWKWGVNTETTAFYGRNVKLFRNDHPVDWNVAKIREAIERM